MRLKGILIAQCIGMSFSFIFMASYSFAQENILNFADKLEHCQPYTGKFIHPFTHTEMQRQVVGEVDGKCLYIEQMPNGGKMECRYSIEQRTAVAQEYRNISSSKNEEVDISAGVSTGGGKVSMSAKTSYKLDGKEVQSPLQECMQNGTCKITGY